MKTILFSLFAAAVAERLPEFLEAPENQSSPPQSVNETAAALATFINQLTEDHPDIQRTGALWLSLGSAGDISPLMKEFLKWAKFGSIAESRIPVGLALKLDFSRGEVTLIVPSKPRERTLIYPPLVEAGSGDDLEAVLSMFRKSITRGETPWMIMRKVGLWESILHSSKGDGARFRRMQTETFERFIGLGEDEINHVRPGGVLAKDLAGAEVTAGFVLLSRPRQ
jgi:hypothetical protein